jgi:hypothetical protein
MKATDEKGREYELRQVECNAELRTHLISNGWTGDVFIGTSQPKGRQRKTFVSMFYQNAKTDEFCVVRVLSVSKLNSIDSRSFIK